MKYLFLFLLLITPTIEADEIKEEIGSDKAKKILNALEKI